MMNLLKKPIYLRLRMLIWLLIGSVFVFYALNLLYSMMHSDSGIQIRASGQGIALPDGFYVYQCLSDHGIKIESITPDHNSLVIRFNSLEQRQAAERLLRQVFPYGIDIYQFETTNSIIEHGRTYTQQT